MQQTTKYKLNLIEPTDPFLPDGLNANTQKVEDALAAHEAAVGEVTDGLDARVTVLEGFHCAFGVSTSGNVDVGFDPVLVIISNNGQDIHWYPRSQQNTAFFWMENGFVVGGPGVRYIAFG